MSLLSRFLGKKENPDSPALITKDNNHNNNNNSPSTSPPKKPRDDEAMKKLRKFAEHDPTDFVKRAQAILDAPIPEDLGAHPNQHFAGKLSDTMTSRVSEEESCLEKELEQHRQQKMDVYGLYTQVPQNNSDYGTSPLSASITVELGYEDLDDRIEIQQQNKNSPPLRKKTQPTETLAYEDLGPVPKKTQTTETLAYEDLGPVPKKMQPTETSAYEDLGPVPKKTQTTETLAYEDLGPVPKKTQTTETSAYEDLGPVPKKTDIANYGSIPKKTTDSAEVLKSLTITASQETRTSDDQQHRQRKSSGGSTQSSRKGSGASTLSRPILSDSQSVRSESDFELEINDATETGQYQERFPILLGVQNSDLQSHISRFEVGDWNQQFQSVTQARLNFVPNTSRHQRLAVSLMFINLARDFLFKAITYSKVIVTEQFLPFERKTIRPTSSFGGIAGGEKYIVSNILFKFATDSFGLYGSDRAAAKVADHELKGASACYNTNIGISVPFVCTIEYLGFKMIATSILPIDKFTIINGSDNGGKTVYNTNSDFRHLSEKMALELNLCPHICGIEKTSATKLWTACDTEGHLGSDGRFYMLDFARVFPPVQPDHKHQSFFLDCLPFESTFILQGHLYRLFRPEFVRKYKTPLCSDGFSKFIMHDPEYPRYNADLNEATQVLTEKVIPSVAMELDSFIVSAFSNKSIANIGIAQFVHARGVNLRYLGLLRQHMRNYSAKIIVTFEIIIRTIKHDINHKLRERARHLKSVVEEPHRRIIIDVLNRLYAIRSQTSYWDYIYELACSYFPGSIPIEERRFLKQILLSFTIHDPYKKVTKIARHFLIQSLQNALYCEPLKDDELLIFKLADSKSNRPRVYSLIGGNIRQGQGLQTPKAIISIHQDDLTQILTAQSTFSLCQVAKKIEIEGDNNFAHEKMNNLFNSATRPKFMFSEDSFLYDGRFLLLNGISKALKLKFSFSLNPNEYATSSLRQRLFLSKVPFGLAELDEISVRTKCINVIAASAGTIYHHLGEVYSEVRYEYAATQAYEHYLSALERFKEAIEVDARSKDSLRGAAVCLRGLAKYQKGGQKFGEAAASYRQAREYLWECLQLDPKDPVTLLECALLFFQERENELSESFFLRALEEDSNYLNALRAYAKFISKVHSPINSKPFYGRINSLLEQLRKQKSFSQNSGDMIDLSGGLDEVPASNFF